MRPTKFSLLEIELDRADAADAVLAENTGLVCDLGTNEPELPGRRQHYT